MVNRQQEVDAIHLDGRDMSQNCRMEQDTASVPKFTHLKWYVCGPLGGDWLQGLSKLGGNTLFVALYLQHLRDAYHTDIFYFTPQHRRQLGLSRKGAYKLLERLAEHGYIYVERQRGSFPRIECLTFPPRRRKN